jgi:hypothetical protein
VVEDQISQDIIEDDSEEVSNKYTAEYTYIEAGHHTVLV